MVGLQAVGTNVTRPVDELILENNHLPSLPGNMFSALRVVRLMLRDNGLERVAASWLAGLEDTLLEVFVVEPRLRSLPVDSLEQLRGLEAVTLQGGAIKRLPRFSGLSRVRYLHVQSPSLLELSPLGFKSMGDLEQMHVTFSPHLTRLEGGFLQDLPRLRVLNVSHCGLTWVHPRALATLPALKELCLVGNRLNDAGMVGRAARELPALAVLRLDDNRFDRLGEASFVDLPSLREVTLAGNLIADVQRGAFDRLPALRRLDLSRNRVRRIHPEAFRQHSSTVEELWLSANAIHHVAEVRSLLDALPRLRYLDLSYNFIEEIPFGALRGHPTLERLHLDHNRVQHIQREAFTAMPALRELRLRNNSLSNFLDGPYWNLPALKVPQKYSKFSH
jgi:Leucine-rich repeat (LRR) protein